MPFGELFLQRPERFPSSLAGETWGEGALDLMLPGGAYRFSGLDPRQQAWIQERMPDFVSHEIGWTPGVACRVYRVHPGVFRRFDMKGWEYQLDVRHEARSILVAGVDLMARIEQRPSESSLRAALWTSATGREAFCGAFENVLRLLCSHRLVDVGAILIHSAGIISSGAGFLFFGHSGAGKTTVSRRSWANGRTVLSDDLNAVLVACERPIIRRLPFWGERELAAPGPASAPLRAIFRLRKGSRSSIGPMKRGEALARLLSCSPGVNVNPYRQDVTLSLLQALVETVPVGVLTFSLEEDFWHLLDEDAPGPLSSPRHDVPSLARG